MPKKSHILAVYMKMWPSEDDLQIGGTLSSILAFQLNIPINLIPVWVLSKKLKKIALKYNMQPHSS